MLCSVYFSIRKGEDKIISSPPAKDNITSTEYTVSIFLLKRTVEGYMNNEVKLRQEVLNRL